MGRVFRAVVLGLLAAQGLAGQAPESVPRRRGPSAAVSTSSR